MRWARFGFIVAFTLLVLLAVMFGLNFTGDCPPEAMDCGRTQRQISLLVLAFGLIGLGYYAFRFMRSR